MIKLILIVVFLGGGSATPIAQVQTPGIYDSIESCTAASAELLTNSIPNIVVTYDCIKVEDTDGETRDTLPKVEG